MIPTSLKIALIIGISSGAITTLVLADIRDTPNSDSNNKLVLTTDKLDYKKGEVIHITLNNYGDTPLYFADDTYGLAITALDGMLIHLPQTSDSKTITINNTISNLDDTQNDISSNTLLPSTSGSSVIINNNNNGNDDTAPTLLPNQKHTILWNQQKNDGTFVFDGIYKITITALDENHNNIQYSKTINIVQQHDLTFGS